MRLLMAIGVLFFSLSALGQQQVDSSLSWAERWRACKDSAAANNETYRTGGIAAAYSGLQDTRMSPLIFRGMGVALDVQRLSYGTKKLSDWQLKLTYIAGFSNRDQYSPMHLGRIDLNYAYQRKIPTKKGKLYLGAALNNLLNLRLYNPLGNNAFAMDYTLALSPKATWLLENIGKKNSMLLVSGGLSAVSFALRYPEFAYRGLEIQVLGMGRFNRYFFEIGWSPKLRYSNENRMYVAYLFDAYNFASSNDGKKVSQYVNSVKFAYFLKTK